MNQREVLITGVTRGLGRALARNFAARGIRIAGCGRSESGIAALAAELGPQHFLHPVDIAAEKQVVAWSGDLQRAEFQAGLVINNAALINRNAPLWQVPSAEFAALLHVNLLGIHHIVQHFLPGMISRGRGVVVNFSSGWGRTTSPEVAPYCATKWGVEGLTRALASELPAGLAAVALNPGIIQTDMLASCFGSDAAAYPDPDQWADRAAPLLLSLGAEHNGRSLDVPG